MTRIFIAIMAFLITSTLQAASIMNLIPSMDSIQLRSDGSAVVPYTLTNNTASTPLHNITIDFGISGGNSNGLSTINDNCTGATLVPSASCTFQVFIQGESQPLNFILTPRACSQNVCSQATAGNRPSVTVIPINHPVRAYFGLFDTTNPFGNPLNNTMKSVSISDLAVSSPLSGFNLYFTALLPTNNLPAGVTVSPDGNSVYLTNVGDTGINQDTVSFIDVSSGTPVITAYVPVGHGPTYVVATSDGSTLYVTNFAQLFIGQPGSVSVIDVATQTVTATVSFAPGSLPIAAALSPDNATLYVSDPNTSLVYSIDTATNTLGPTFTGFTIPEFLTVSPDGSRLYVPNFGVLPGTISVMNANNAAAPPIATIPVGDSPSICVLSPSGSTLYVSNINNNHTGSFAVSVIDTTTLVVTNTIVLPAAPGALSVTPDGSQLYISHGAGISYITIMNTSDFSTQQVGVGDSQLTLGNFIG